MKVIITGTTGMVGEGVLLEALRSDEISHVLSVSRRPCGILHPKLTEYLVPNFLELKSGDEKLKGYDACFFCAGVSSVGKSEPEYTLLTYDTTIAFARALEPKSQLTFIYVSGRGTDSTERGRQMWARVKGKTENDLAKLGFKQSIAFRPGIMIASEGQKHVLSLYKYFAWLIPIAKRLTPNAINTMRQVGQAMIHAAKSGYEKSVVEVRDITALASRYKASEGILHQRAWPSRD